jgi:hypothetical protein
VKLLPFVQSSLAHPSDYLLGSLVHWETHCLRHSRPLVHSVEGHEFEHQELGKMSFLAPFYL